MGVRYGGGQPAAFAMASELGWLADLFYYIAGKINGVPLLGPYLSDPFSWAGDYFRDLENLMNAFADYYGDVVKTAIAALPSASLGSAILTMFHEWNEFRTNPTAWIKKHFIELLKDGEKFFQDWFKWFLDRVKDYDKKFRNFFEKPYEQMVDWVHDKNVDLYDWIHDPLGKLREYLRKISSEGYQLLNTPKEYIKELVIILFDFPLQFWSDPFKYLVLWALDRYRLVRRDILDLIMRDLELALRYLWERK